MHPCPQCGDWTTGICGPFCTRCFLAMGGKAPTWVLNEVGKSERERWMVGLAELAKKAKSEPLRLPLGVLPGPMMKDELTNGDLVTYKAEVCGVDRSGPGEWLTWRYVEVGRQKVADRSGMQNVAHDPRYAPAGMQAMSPEDLEELLRQQANGMRGLA